MKFRNCLPAAVSAFACCKPGCEPYLCLAPLAPCPTVFISGPICELLCVPRRLLGVAVVEPAPCVACRFTFLMLGSSLKRWLAPFLLRRIGPFAAGYFVPYSRLELRVA